MKSRTKTGMMHRLVLGCDDGERYAQRISSGCDIANKMTPPRLSTSIVGSGPFGEKPSTVDSVKLTPNKRDKAKGWQSSKIV